MYPIQDQPMYAGRITNRGGAMLGQPEYTTLQSRTGNPIQRNGMDAYMIHAENAREFFSASKVKPGNAGVYANTRWEMPLKYSTEDFRSGEMTRNYLGGKKQAELSIRPNMNLIDRQNHKMQNNDDNAGGIYESKRHTPCIIREIDYTSVKQLERNPFFIPHPNFQMARQRWAEQKTQTPELDDPVYIGYGNTVFSELYKKGK